jgi:hypothetical protein
MMDVQTAGAAAEKAVALESRREKEKTDETRHSEFIDAINNIKLAVAPPEEEGGLIGWLLKLLGLGAAGALGLATGLVVGWTAFVANMLIDLGKLVGKGLKKLSPKWLDDFFKAFTKEGKLAKSVMKFIDDFKAPKWVDNFLKQFTKEGKIAKNVMKFIDDFKMPKFLDDFFKAFTKEGKIAKGAMKFIDDFKMPKFLDDFFKAFTKEGKLGKKVMGIIDNFKMPKLGFLDAIGDFFKKSKAFGQLADNIADITKGMPDAKGGALTKIGNAVKNLFGGFGDIWKGVKGFFAPITKLFGSGGGKMISTFTDFLTPFKKVFSGFAKVGKVIAAPITVIMGIIDGFFEAKDAVGKSEGIMATMVNAVVGAIGGFIDGAIFQLLDLLKSGISWIAGFFGFDEVEKFLDSFSFSEMFNKFLDGIYNFVNAMFKWETYVTLFNDAVSYITGTGEGSLLGSISALFSGISDWFMGLFDFSSMESIVASTINVIFMPLNALMGLVTGIWNWFKGLFGFETVDTGTAEADTKPGGIGGMLVSLVSGVWTWFKGLFGFGEKTTPADDADSTSGVLGFLTGLVTGIWTWFKSLFDFSSISGAFASVLNVIFLPYTILTGLVEGIWNWFAGLFGFDTISTADADSDVTTAGGVGGVLVKLVSGIWTWFKGLFGFGETTTPAEQEEGGVLSFLTGMVTGVWTWFKGLFDFSSFGAGLASAAKLIFLPYTALIDLVGAVWTWFSGLFGWTDETKPKDDRTLTQKLTGLLGDVWTWFTGIFGFGADDKPKDDRSISTMLSETLDAIWAWFTDLFNDIKSFDFGKLAKSVMPGFMYDWFFGDKEAEKTEEVKKAENKKPEVPTGVAGLETGAPTDFLGNMLAPIRNKIEGVFADPPMWVPDAVTNFFKDTLLELLPVAQKAKGGGLVGSTIFPTMTLPKMEEGGMVGMSPLASGSLGKAMGLESGGLFTLSQGEFVLDNQAAQTFMKAAQLLTNSQALEQSRAGGGPPVVINQVDNSQANPVISNQATQIKASESPHARESTKAMLDQAYAMG